MRRPCGGSHARVRCDGRGRSRTSHGLDRGRGNDACGGEGRPDRHDLRDRLPPGEEPSRGASASHDAHDSENEGEKARRRLLPGRRLHVGRPREVHGNALCVGACGLRRCGRGIPYGSEPLPGPSRGRQGRGALSSRPRRRARDRSRTHRRSRRLGGRLPRRNARDYLGREGLGQGRFSGRVLRGVGRGVVLRDFGSTPRPPSPRRSSCTARPFATSRG